MKKINRFAGVALAVVFALAVTATLFAAEKRKAENPGYSVRLSATTVDLVFPDGSVLYAPLDFDGKSLDKVKASGGMAQDLLDMGYQQLGLQKNAELPKSFSLAQNFPNPFNPSTTVSYSIPENSPEVAVRLDIYNIRGQMVKTLVNATQGPGEYQVSWDGTGESGQVVSSGVYFYRVRAGDYVSTRKMVLLK